VQGASAQESSRAVLGSSWALVCTMPPKHNTHPKQESIVREFKVFSLHHFGKVAGSFEDHGDRVELCDGKTYHNESSFAVRIFQGKRTVEVLVSSTVTEVSSDSD
jgi:hypothetical protein